MNTYAYVINNPIKYTDRLGLELDGSWGEAPPYFPNQDEHMNRNRNNMCPQREPNPDTDDQCTSWNKDEDGGLASMINGGKKKWRRSNGYECYYDSFGNLIPDVKDNYTYNYSNDFLPHLWQDVAPHFWWNGAYTPGLTTVY